MHGRNREPIDLIIAKGKKHLTKKEIEERRGREIHAPSDAITPPDFLTKKEKTKFKELADRLIELKILTNLDVDALARYIVSQEMLERVSRKMRSREVASDLDLFDRYSRIQDRYIKMCRTSASDLGLTISSRCKLVLPEKPIVEAKVNKFSKFEPKRV